MDRNVFDIQQGVAIGIFVKQAGISGPARVRHADLWGERQGKYEVLASSDVTTTVWEQLQPAPSNDYRFKPWDTELGLEYTQWPKITEVMSVNSVGVVTARDKLTIHWSDDEVMRVARDFAALPPEDARIKYQLGRDAQDWKVHLAQDDLNVSELRAELVTPILYRPFDTRYTYHTGASRGFICRPRADVMRHMMIGDNLGLITCRQQSQIGPQWSHIGVAKSMIESCSISNKTREINYLFPIYWHPSERQIDQGSYQPGERRPNLDPGFTSELGVRLGLEFVTDGRGDLESSFGPEDVFHYIYAVLHSTEYRERYAQFLRADFPRIPPPNDSDQFPRSDRAGAGS